MSDEITIDVKKYKKLFGKKTIFYFLLYPFIAVVVLLILAKIIIILGFNDVRIIIPIIFVSGFLILSPLTTLSFYSGYKNKYISTKFVLLEGNILFILLKSRNAIAGGTFYYHNIQSISSYSITNEKIIVNGHITKRQVDEGYPNNQYKERVIESFSVPNIFGNVQLLEQALKNKKQEVIDNGN